MLLRKTDMKDIFRFCISVVVYGSKLRNILTTVTFAKQYGKQTFSLF